MEAVDCFDAERLLNERFDGILPPEDARRLAEHLAQCAGCQAKERQMQTIIEAETQRTLEDPGQDFAARVMGRLRAESRPVAFWKPAAGLAVLAAMLLALKQLWLSGFGLGGLLDAAAGVLDRIAAEAIEAWQGLSAAVNSGALAAQQSSQWLPELQPYLPVLAGALAVLLLLLAAARLTPARRAGERGE